MPKEDEDRRFALWAEHMPALHAWLTVSGQLRAIPRFGAAPIWLGLDYTAAHFAWIDAGIDITPDIFAEIREIEHGALQILKNR